MKNKRYSVTIPNGIKTVVMAAELFLAIFLAFSANLRSLSRTTTLQLGLSEMR